MFLVVLRLTLVDSDYSVSEVEDASLRTSAFHSRTTCSLLAYRGSSKTTYNIGKGEEVPDTRERVTVPGHHLASKPLYNTSMRV